MLAVASPPYLTGAGQPMKMEGVRRTRRAGARRDRNNKTSSRARKNEFYPRHSSKECHPSFSSTDSLGSLQRKGLFGSEDKTGEKRNQHDLRWHGPTRRRCCSRSGSSTSSESNTKRPHSMKRHSLSAAEIERVIGDRLVKSIRAALETSGNVSPKRRRERGAVETDTLPSTEQTTPRSGYDPEQAGDARERALESGIEFGQLNDGVSKPATRADGAGRNAEEAGGLTCEAGSLPDRLVHDRCPPCLGNDTEKKDRGVTNEETRATPTRTRRARRVGHCGAQQHGCGCGVPVAEGCRDSTKAEVLIARQILFAIRVTVREEIRWSLHSRDGPQSSGKRTDQETRARDAEEDVEDKCAATLQEEVGDDGSKNQEGSNSAAKHDMTCREEAGAAAVQGRIGADGNATTAPPHVRETEKSRPGVPDDGKEGQRTPAQPVCTIAGSGEGSGPAARPSARKTIAEQVDEVSARLDRIFVVPLSDRWS